MPEIDNRPVVLSKRDSFGTGGVNNEYEEYSSIYFDSCVIVSWCLCVVAALSMFFGIRAGYASAESDRMCYPKK